MDTTKSILQEIEYALPSGEHIQFSMKRDDLIDNLISGNKWRKLNYNIEQARHLKKSGVLTFGGAYSNHLVATAKAGSLFGLKTIGIVRGEELTPTSNDTLKQCAEFGMELLFVPRSEYQERGSYEYQSCLKDQFQDYLIIPEGGANFHGVVGCQEIMLETANDFDHIVVASGTGTTAAGILLSIPDQSNLHVYSALKGEFLLKDITGLLKGILYNDEVVDTYINQLTFSSDSLFGGYGKWNQELIDFIQDFYHQTGVKLDPIYTGKAVYKMIHCSRIFAHQSKVLFIHTGGIQGVKGVEQKLGYQLFI